MSYKQVFCIRRCFTLQVRCMFVSHHVHSSLCNVLYWKAKKVPGERLGQRQAWIAFPSQSWSPLVISARCACSRTMNE